MNHGAIMACMDACIITPPASKKADFGVLFMHNEGWSTMCGHGIIAVVTMVIETGRFEITEDQRDFIIDSPAGIVKATATVKNGKVTAVACEHVPSFVLQKDITLEIQNRKLSAAVAFGGAFYAIVNSADLGLSITKNDLGKLQSMATRIKKIVENKYEIFHPLEKDLQGIYGVIFSDHPVQSNADLRNVTIFADEQVDRSPCGTGTAARLAALWSEGQLQEGESFVHESITNGQFIGKIVGTATVGKYTAIKPLVTGKAFITGFHQFVVDRKDPLATGFLLEK